MKLAILAAISSPTQTPAKMAASVGATPW